jgi:cbb3-type cytochrome oxidase maturation protein
MSARPVPRGDGVRVHPPIFPEASMSVILLLIIASLTMALLFLGCFVWSVRSGQYDDTSTPALRMLAEDAPLANAKQGPAAPTRRGAIPDFGLNP